MTEKKTTRKIAKPKKESVEKIEDVKVEQSAPKEIKRKKSIDLNMLVACRNVHDGEVIYVSKKTGLQTLWSAYGDIEHLDVGELITMKASQPRFMDEPWIVVDDEEVAEYLGLNKLYEKLVDVDDLDSFFEKPVDEMENILNKLPKGIKDSIAIRARKKVEDETLYDTRKIRLLDEKLNIDLSILL